MNTKDFFLKNKLFLTAAGLGIVLIVLVVALILSTANHEADKPDDSTPSTPSTSSSAESGSTTVGSASADTSASSASGDSTETKGDQTTMATNHNTAQNTTQANRSTTTKTTTSAKTSVTTKPTASGLKNYRTYNAEAWLTPVWKGNVVYNESIMFFPNAKTKQIESAPLLYKPDKIIALYDSELQTQYKEGVDFVVENGRIKLTTDSNIATWPYDQYYLPQPASVPIASVSAPGRYVKYASGDQFAVMQLAVTYTHSDKWTGKMPTYAGSRLPVTVEKLTKKQALSIVYYGDSIMTGCEASSTHHLSPNMPIYPDMVTARLKSVFGNSKITAVNTAVGGKETNWGLAEIRNRVSKYNPDLVLIGFGMNDSGVPISVEQYKKNILAMIADVRSVNPKAEFLLISTTLPNPDCAGWTNLQPKYQAALESIVAQTQGTALVPMTDIHQYLLKHKRYDDMNGNGVNHPNDFLCRIYAQAVLQTLIKDYQ